MNSIADLLRARAARYRRMRSAIDDAQARAALESLAEAAEGEAAQIEAANAAALIDDPGAIKAAQLNHSVQKRRD
jgi:hypothetical protein